MPTSLTLTLSDIVTMTASGVARESRHYQHTLGFQHDVIKWKHFSRYRPFVRGIHRSSVNSPYKGKWREALIFSLICAWINGWVNNRDAGDLRRHSARYDVIVMIGGWCFSWWRHQMETFSALLALCGGNPPVTGGFSQRSMTRSFDVFVDLRLNKRLSKQLRRWWFETRHPAHYDVNIMFDVSLSKPLNKKKNPKNSWDPDNVRC